MSSKSRVLLSMILLFTYVFFNFSAAYAGGGKKRRCNLGAGTGSPSNAVLFKYILKVSNQKIRDLLDRGIDVKPVDNFGATALHYAAGRGRAEVVGWLVEKGIDINAKDGFGRTPLHYAAANGRSITVKWILEFYNKIIDVNVKDRWGMTPLHCAAMSSSIDTINYLVSLGQARLDICDIWGKLPSDYGREYNRNDVFEKTFFRFVRDVGSLNPSPLSPCGTSSLGDGVEVLPNTLLYMPPVPSVGVKRAEPVKSQENTNPRAVRDMPAAPPARGVALQGKSSLTSKEAIIVSDSEPGLVPKIPRLAPADADDAMFDAGVCTLAPLSAILEASYHKFAQNNQSLVVPGSGSGIFARPCYFDVNMILYPNQFTEYEKEMMVYYSLLYASR